MVGIDWTAEAELQTRKLCLRGCDELIDGIVSAHRGKWIRISRILGEDFSNELAAARRISCIPYVDIPLDNALHVSHVHSMTDV